MTFRQAQCNLIGTKYINPLNAELNPIWHLLALLGAHHILHVSRIRVKNHIVLSYADDIAILSQSKAHKRDF